MTDTEKAVQSETAAVVPDKAATLTPAEMVLGYERDIAATLTKVEAALAQTQQQVNQFQAARQALVAQRDLVADMKSKMNLK
ncbi:MAG: hypothetical protein EBU46_00760 [Nitrosomonadaceae bacterium]|nr:hypothetical protein [Nitrosomonadaceae bacterium]